MAIDRFEVEAGVFLLLNEGKVSEARLDGEIVTIAGIRYANTAIDPRKWNPAASANQASGRATIKAPMPGKVVRVLVKPGDSVEAGQGMVVVEAMKMLNELKSSRAGSVSEVHVKQNDTVEAGTPLITIG